MNNKGGPLYLIFLSNHPCCGTWKRETQDIQAWATALKGDVYNYLRFNLLDAIKDYDLIMIELTSQVFEVVKKIKRKYPNKKIIGVLEGSLHCQDGEHPVKTRLGFVEVYREVDVLGVLIKDSVPYFKTITDKPVFWLGVPFPLEWSKKHLISPEKKEAIIELANSFNHQKGGLTNYIVLRGIQDKPPKVKGCCYSYNKSSDIKAAKLLGLDLDVRSGMDWPEYYVAHSKSYIGLHLDYRWTWNRYSLDCAAAGIPCISTKHATTHKMLFPQLCVDPFDTNQAIQIAKKLLENKSFYDECREYALEKITLFNYENSKKRFMKFWTAQK